MPSRLRAPLGARRGECGFFLTDPPRGRPSGAAEGIAPFHRSGELSFSSKYQIPGTSDNLTKPSSHPMYHIGTTNPRVKVTGYVEYS